MIFGRCFGCSVIEGYGMTETSCVITIMEDGDNLSGHVGSPNPACGEFFFGSITRKCNVSYLLLFDCKLNNSYC